MKLEARSRLKAGSIDEDLASKDETVRYKAILNEHATIEHIRKALKDECKEVREAAASHRNMDLSTLQECLNSKDPVVRGVAAGSLELTEAQLDKALKDHDPLVRAGAVTNDNITYEQLEPMLGDHDATVRKEAEAMMKTLKKYKKGFGDEPALEQDDEESNGAYRRRLQRTERNRE